MAPAPPEPVIVQEAGVPTVNVEQLLGEMDTCGTTVSVKFCGEALSPALLVAEVVNVSVPDAVGVPLIVIEPVPLAGTVTPGTTF